MRTILLIICFYFIFVFVNRNDEHFRYLKAKHSKNHTFTIKRATQSGVYKCEAKTKTNTTAEHIREVLVVPSKLTMEFTINTIHITFNTYYFYYRKAIKTVFSQSNGEIHAIIC